MAKPLPRIDSEQQRPERPNTTEHQPNVMTVVRPEENYATSMAHVRRIDVVLPAKHRKIMSDKIRLLQDSGAKLQDGTEVTDKTKAVLWILENEVMV